MNKDYLSDEPIIPVRSDQGPRKPRRHPAIDPVIQSAMAIDAVVPHLTHFADEPEMTSSRTVIQQLRDETEKLKGGDTGYVEEALLCQGQILQAIFVQMVEWVFASPSKELLDARLLLALRVQNNSRMTLEALIKSRNAGHAMVFQQQVVMQSQRPEGGGVAAGTTLQANPANELLEEKTYERLATRASSAAGNLDPQMEAVETGRRQDPGRQDN